MSTINNERSERRDDNNNEIDNETVEEIANEYTRASSDKALSVEGSGHSTDDPERVEESKPVDVPPDGGYGWVCVACVFLINAHTWGVNSVSERSCP